MRTYLFQLVTDGNIASNSATSGQVASSAQKIDYTYAYSIQATYTGTFPQGQLTLEGSNDGVHFLTVAGSTVTLSAGTSGTTVWNTQFSNYDYMKVRFRATSASSGVLNAVIYSKGN